LEIRKLNLKAIKQSFKFKDNVNVIKVERCQQMLENNKREIKLRSSFSGWEVAVENMTRVGDD